MFLFVDVRVKFFGGFIVPVNADADGIEGVEAGVGVAGQEIAVGAGGFAEDDALDFYFADAGE